MAEIWIEIRWPKNGPLRKEVRTPTLNSFFVKTYGRNSSWGSVSDAWLTPASQTSFKVHFVYHPIWPFWREEHMRLPRAHTCTKRRCSDMATMASEASLKWSWTECIRVRRFIPDVFGSSANNENNENTKNIKMKKTSKRIFEYALNLSPRCRWSL